jgi:Transposase DDE domain
MLLDEFIIRVYCEAYAAVASTPLRRRGFAPALSDQEALEMVGAYLGMNQDKQIWCYFHRHWRAWFPGLGAHSTFVRQSANLWVLKQRMHRHWVRRLGACKGALHLVDGFPVPVRHFRRAHFSQVFRGEETFGHYASKQQTYYGFKAMLIASGEGVIQGIRLGDKGFIRPILKEYLASQGIDLHTPLRSNMLENRPSGFMRRAARTRRLVETVIGQLCERFEIERNRARDLWHLVSRLYRKVAAHTLCVLLNRQLGRPCLHLDGLVLP